MKTSPDFLVAIAERLGWALLHSLWQGAAIAAVLAVALHLMRRRNAAARHALCLLAILMLVGTTVVTAWVIRPVARAVSERARPELVVPNAAADAAVFVSDVFGLENPVVARGAGAAADCGRRRIGRLISRRSWRRSSRFMWRTRTGGARRRGRA